MYLFEICVFICLKSSHHKKNNFVTMYGDGCKLELLWDHSAVSTKSKYNVVHLKLM